jgi:hypothetical protein
MLRLMIDSTPPGAAKPRSRPSTSTYSIAARSAGIMNSRQSDRYGDKFNFRKNCLTESSKMVCDNRVRVTILYIYFVNYG